MRSDEASASGSHAVTRLAVWRLHRDVTQRALARAIGVSRDTLSRLERGEIDNPPLRYLTNCAIALDVDLDELIEPYWREQWLTLDKRAPRPQHPLRGARAAKGSPDLPPR